MLKEAEAGAEGMRLSALLFARLPESAHKRSLRLRSSHERPVTSSPRWPVQINSRTIGPKQR